MGAILPAFAHQLDHTSARSSKFEPQSFAEPCADPRAEERFEPLITLFIVFAEHSAVLCLQGHVAATSPAFAHRLDHVFERSGKFEPERFAEPRAEDRVKPFSFTGFGGGRHGCMGTTFAYLQVRLQCLRRLGGVCV